MEIQEISMIFFMKIEIEVFLLAFLKLQDRLILMFSLLFISSHSA